MMHEEFMELTGLKISMKFYTEQIEPEYVAKNVDKQIFCADWVKENKSRICKGVSDINALSQEAAIGDTIRASAKRDREERAAAEKRSKELENENATLKASKEDLVEKIMQLKWELESRQSAQDDLKEAQTKLENQARNYESAINAKNAEIMRLKAMLFDQMMKTA